MRILAIRCLSLKGGVIRAIAPILPSLQTARLCASILDRRDTVPAPRFSTAVNNWWRGWWCLEEPPPVAQAAPRGLGVARESGDRCGSAIDRAILFWNLIGFIF